MQHGLSAAKVEHHALRLLAVAVVSAIFLYLTRQIIIGASREIEFDLRNDLFANLERQPPELLPAPPHRRHHGAHHQRPQRRPPAPRPGHHVLRQHHRLHRRRAALHAAHQPAPHAVRLPPAALASVLVQSFGARIHMRFERIQAMFSDISAQAEENFSGARLIRAFAQEDAQIAAFETSNHEYIRRSLLLARLMAMLWPTLEFVLGLSLMITLLVGGHEVVAAHRITVGQFATFNIYMVQLTWPMIAIGWVVNLFQRGTASVVRIHELMTEKPTIDDAAADPTLLIRAPQDRMLAARS